MKSKNKTIAVGLIEITIAGTTLKLTLEQVKELKSLLAKSFPEPETKTVYVPGPERVVERPMPRWDMMRVAQDQFARDNLKSIR